MKGRRWVHTGCGVWRDGHDGPYGGFVIAIKKFNDETRQWDKMEYVAIPEGNFKTFESAEEAKEWLGDRE